MFEEKIQFNAVKVNNIVTKKIHGQEVKFNKYLDQPSCEFIAEKCVEEYAEAINEKKSPIKALNYALQIMNAALCFLTTDIDMENIAYEDLHIMGVFKAIEETLINYSEIKSLVLESISIIYDNIIYKALEELPTSKGMIDALENIKEIFKSDPEKAKEFANIIASNHPELKNFGEIFEKILNNQEKKE